MKTRVRCCFTAMVWIGKWNVNILTNMHCLTAEGNFTDDNGHAVEPATVQVCNRCMWYMDKSDGITNSPLADWPGNGLRSYSSNFLDLTILKSFVTLASFSSNLTHWLRHKHRHKYKDNITQILINMVVSKQAEFSWLRIASCGHTNEMFWVPQKRSGQILGDWLLCSGAQYLWVVSMELASSHPSGT
jgi:hypothetical protein